MSVLNITLNIFNFFLFFFFLDKHDSHKEKDKSFCMNTFVPARDLSSDKTCVRVRLSFLTRQKAFCGQKTSSFQPLPPARNYCKSCGFC